jgi:3-hydroxyisobutyrate dehydrogenase
MGTNFFACGGLSTGQVAKVCNNLALAIQMFSVAEANAIAYKFKLSANKLQDVILVLI